MPDTTNNFLLVSGKAASINYKVHFYFARMVANCIFNHRSHLLDDVIKGLQKISFLSQSPSNGC